MNKTFTLLLAAASLFSASVSAQTETTSSDTIDASEFFPLDELNAHIWDPDNKATYDATTHSLTTAQYGFGGWQSETPVDLSDYQTLIVTLKEAQTTGANFRMFDENNYFSSCTQTDIGDATSVSIDLTTVKKVDGDSLVDFDPSHFMFKTKYILTFNANLTQRQSLPAVFSYCHNSCHISFLSVSS